MAKLTGAQLALITSIISGVSIFANKYAVTAIKQPLIFTTVKNTGVALLILALVIANRKLPSIKKLSPRDLAFLAIIGVIGGSIPFYLFFQGLSTTSAINGALIQKTLVVWVALFSIPFLKEKLSFTSWLGVTLLFASNFLIGGFTGFKYSSGEFLILLATLFWAAETALAKKILPHIDPDLLTLSRMGVGSLILLGLSASLQPTALGNIALLSSSQWAWLGITMVLLLTYVTTWYRSLKLAPATTVTAILVSSTLITNLLSALFVTHKFNVLLTPQSLFIILGLILLLKPHTAQSFSSSN